MIAKNTAQGSLLRLGIILLLSINFFLSACGNDSGAELVTGPIQTEQVNVNDPKSFSVEIPSGEFNAQGGGSGGITGTVEYNVANLKPAVEGANSPSITLKQNLGDNRLPGTGVVNKWNLKLANANPFDFKVVLSNGSVNTTFGNTQLNSFNAKISNGNLTANFDQPQSNLSQISSEVANGNVTLNGLSNIGTSGLNVKVGSGQIYLDFSKGLKVPYQGMAGVGNGDITLAIPSGLGVKINANIVTGNFSSPGFTRQGNQTIWTNEEYNKGGNTLTLNLAVSNGSIKIAMKS